MNRYTALIVDDMVEAQLILESDIVNHCPNIEIIGKATSIIEAAKFLRRKKPDILFLDIMLEDGTGFDLLEIYPNISSQVIFVTASDEHAIKAFRFAAIDYLLKPIDPEQLREAVAKATGRIVTKGEQRLDVLKETINNPDQLPKRVSLHSLDRITIVEIDQIIRCESDGNNTIFHLNDGTDLFVTKTLKSFNELFKEHNFMRVHQSHLVNTDYIHEYIRKDGGYLKMKNGDNVSVSLRKKTEVINMLDRL